MSVDIFTISELNGLIKDVVASGFPSSIWVCGEIQNLDRYKSKAHLFFELVEKDAGAKDIKAKLGVTIWAGVRPKIEALLKKAENAFELKDGIEVKFSGKVDFYPPYGTLRFVIDNIDPVYTLGKIAQDRQRLIAELTQAGILLKNKQHVLPQLPLKVGLISAFDSAAYNDFIHELKRSTFSFEVSFYNAVMQGKNCPPSVCKGLLCLAQQKDLDVIVIARGGGSIAELSAFDAKEIVLSIAESGYPVLTGIGHEINTSIADMAAHHFVKTPTAAAQFLVERVKVSLETLDLRRDEVLSGATAAIFDANGGLRAKALGLQELTRALLQSHKEAHVRLAQSITQLPVRLCHDERAHIRSIEEQIKRTVDLRFKSARVKIEAQDKLATMASPARVLKRGFSITRLSSGKLVRSAADVKPSVILVTELTDTKITSRAT